MSKIALSCILCSVLMLSACACGDSLPCSSSPGMGPSGWSSRGSDDRGGGYGGDHGGGYGGGY